MRTHYENLQIAENASLDVIKGAYKFLSQKWHPDKNPKNRAEAERVSRILNEAYAVLSDPMRRKQHDNWIRAKRQEEATNKPRPDAQPDPEHSSAPAPDPSPRQSSSFLKRAWLMLLFTGALVMVLGVFPYQLLWGEFKWGYLAGLLFWLWVGRYTYVQLFRPEIVEEENLDEIARKNSEKEPRKRAYIFGWVVFFGAIPLSVAAMMVRGDEFVVAAFMSLFISAAVGLLGWSFYGLYLRATGRC